jgi:hypothetical protein
LPERLQINRRRGQSFFQILRGPVQHSDYSGGDRLRRNEHARHQQKGPF